MRIPTLGETELLVPLHDGVFEQPMWHTFLRRLAGVARADTAALLIQPTDTGETVQFCFGVDHQLTGVKQVLNVDMREGRVYSGAELGTDLNGNSGQALRCVRLREDGGLEARLVLMADQDIGPEVGNLMVALVPHLRTALRVLAALERERTRSDMNADAFSRMQFGWISIDAKCRIVDCNDHATRFLEQSASLSRGHYDRLTPAEPSVDRQLTALVRQFASDPGSRPRAINLSQDPWVDILVSPLRVTALSGSTPAVAAVYLRGDRSSSADRCEQLTDTFDLTPSEARLAWSMAQGLTIAEAAEEARDHDRDGAILFEANIPENRFARSGGPRPAYQHRRARADLTMDRISRRRGPTGAQWLLRR